jgi:hypothetical protein
MGMKGKLRNQKREITPTAIPASKTHNFILKKGTTMNPLTQFKNILILPVLIALALVIILRTI